VSKQRAERLLYSIAGAARRFPGEYRNTTDKKVAKSMAKAIDKKEKALKDLAKGDETKGAQDLLRAYKELGCDDAEGNGFCNAIADVMPKILITR